MMKQTLTYTDLYACAFALYIALHTIWTSNNLMERGDWLVWGYVVTCYILTRCLPSSWQNRLLVIIVISGFIQSLIAWRQFYGWTESNHSSFLVTGSFKNPAPLAGYIGACLILTIELMQLYHKRNRKITFLLIPVAVSMFGVIILSYSRAAWLALLILIAWQIVRYYKVQRRYLSVIAILLILCSAGFYFLKKESADARLFIWSTSSQLIYTSPLTGSGVNSFASQYMYAQAEYFANHPKSPYKLKASDNNHAFNEYLRIVIEYGIAGFILLFLLFRSVSFLHPVLLFYSVFALFSYPLSIAPIVLLIAIMLASHPGKTICYYSKYVLIAFFLFISCILGYTTYRFKTEEWKLESMIHEYEHLPNPELEDRLYECYPHYKNNRTYIASCAMQFYKNKNYPKAEIMLQRASVLFPSSRILYDLGNCYHNLQKYEEAEQALLTSCNMTPGYILPRYYLFRHYVETNQICKAQENARLIIQDSFKQEGSIALQVRHLTKEYLEKTKKGGE